MTDEYAAQSRRVGRTAATKQAIADALARGEHVHSASVRDGERCHGGDPDCPTPRATPAAPPAPEEG